MVFIHFSIADLIIKSVSLIIVIVQVSKVLSPATFKIRPLNGISTGAMVDEGRAAALTKNLDFCKTSFSLTGETDVGNAKTTSNKLGLAPPPVNLDLKSLIFLNGIVSCCKRSAIV